EGSKLAFPCAECTFKISKKKWQTRKGLPFF
ncbi:MAG: hypothetical protein ACI892_001740, partial [Marinobacter maritimus]